MNNNISTIIANRLSLLPKHVVAVMELIDGGATIPFIARYRKEATGAMDEVRVAAIAEQHEKLRELEKRKSTVLSTIEEQGKLTDALRQRIEGCWDATELEDIYLPYKPKRRTKAQIARERGLEPLALQILTERIASEQELQRVAAKFVKGEVKSAEDALQGARDIIAEAVCEDETCRNAVRREFSYTATITSKAVKGKAAGTDSTRSAKEDEAAKYQDYFNWSEPLKRCSSHRLLAMRRGENEGFLRVTISPDDELALEKLLRLKVHRRGAASDQIEMAVSDGYKRLLKPQIETEFAAQSKEKADAEAIAVFASGLRQLLLAAPLGQKRVMGIDPGFRTGCKIVCLDAQGNLLYHGAPLHLPPRGVSAKDSPAAERLRKLVKQYQIEAIAIGNGTAGRETEAFVREVLESSSLSGQSKGGCSIFSVNEDGASVYSASAVAREEFPNEDVTVRGAVSIARRLMDPLAELVKIDSKSIGVGQYQHDVDQAALKRQLDQVVVSCVNSVGVDVNTASKHLLTYVSGLGPALAQNIVDYRAINGAFKNRKALMKVPRMGTKTFEQCAGFLRIQGGDNPLDNSAVHPESYGVVEQMAHDLRCSVKDLMTDATLRARIDRTKYSTVGEATLTDIIKELEKPSRDPRQQLTAFAFSPLVHTPEDLRPGMRLPGIVSNVTAFGAFVDIGVHEKGLVHVSQLANHYVKDPTTVVSIGQQVEVTVLDVDLKRRRISLSMKE